MGEVRMRSLDQAARRARREDLVLTLVGGALGMGGVLGVFFILVRWRGGLA